MQGFMQFIGFMLMSAAFGVVINLHERMKTMLSVIIFDTLVLVSWGFVASLIMPIDEMDYKSDHIIFLIVLGTIISTISTEYVKRTGCGWKFMLPAGIVVFNCYGSALYLAVTCGE